MTELTQRDIELEQATRISSFFHYHHLAADGHNGPSLLKNIKDFLNEGLSTFPGIELFFQAAKVFQTTELLKGSDRLRFRDEMKILFGKWLNKDFDPDVLMTPSMISKLYTGFTYFEYMMPDRLHAYMEGATVRAVSHLKAQDSARILDYYATTGDAMPYSVYDAAVQGLDRDFYKLKIFPQLRLLECLAMIDTVQGESVRAMPGLEPKDIYRRVVDHLLSAEVNIDHPKFRVAQSWFENIAYTFRNERKKDFSEIDGLISQTEAAGLSVKRDFVRAVEGASLSGSDYAVSEEGRAEVGIIYDTRTGLLEKMGGNFMLRPTGKILLNSAFLHRDNPQSIFLRVSGIVAKNASAQDLAEVYRAASRMKPGVYGLSMQMQVVPLQELKIAV